MSSTNARLEVETVGLKRNGPWQPM
jgi:hypothetical protein